MKYATGGSTASTGKCYLSLVWWHFMQLDEVFNPCYKAHSGSLIIHKVLIGAPAFHSDDRINLDKRLPPPFQERPRLGMRLYIRGTCKRFLSALVAELTNWVSTTRLKSAQLMKMLVILCEEHLTMEAHTLFPALIKAHKFAHDDKDAVLAANLRELFELLGRYVLPEVYVYYILPRLRGDADVVAFGVDTATRIVVMDFLQALLTGSKASMIVPHLDELVTTLTDPFVVPLDSPTLQAAATSLLLTVFQAVKGEGNVCFNVAHVVRCKHGAVRCCSGLVINGFMLVFPSCINRNRNRRALLQARARRWWRRTTSAPAASPRCAAPCAGPSASCCCSCPCPRWLRGPGRPWRRWHS
jgi:hypothetical protein